MKKTRVVGLAIAMALALTAIVGVTAAAASEFIVQTEPSKVSGTRSSKTHKLQLGLESFECQTASFSGESTTIRFKEITTSPTLSECAHHSFSTSWQMNGCKYRFEAGAYQGIGSMSIINCEKPITNTFNGCVTEIPAQSGIGVTYTNVGSGSTKTINAAAFTTGLHYTRSGSGCTGAYGSFVDGSYTGEWSIKGTTLGGTQVAAEIEATPFPSGFAAEEAPVNIAGNDNRVGSFKRFAGLGELILCSKYTLTGTSSTAISEAITVIPSYSGCTLGVGGPTVTVSRGECSYVLHKSGGLDIVGANCASKPVTITAPSCVFTLGPQSGFSGLSFGNEGSGTSRVVSMTGQPSGLTFTRTGASCPGGAGTFSTGQVFSWATLTATNSKGAAQGFWVQ